MRTDLEQRLRYCHNLLPTLPGVALRIIDLANDPDTDMADVAKVIAMDPALVVKIMRVANSSFYGLRRRSNNLRQAINLLGLHATLTLALSFSLGTPFQGQRLTLDTGLYWRRSIIAAVASRSLGTQQGLQAVEELFLAGLLQDIGMLIFDSVMPTEYGPLIVTYQTSPSQPGRLDYDRLARAELSVLGADHAEVGAWLLDYWRLPDYLQWAVAGSQNPAGVEAPDEFIPLLCCVAVSGPIADAWLYPDDQQASIQAAQAARKWLGLSTDEYLAVLNAIGAELPDMSTLFEVQLVDPVQIASILAAAKETLEVQNLLVLQEVIQTKEKNILLESKAQTLEQQSRLDPLTGLFNRGWLEKVLVNEYECANQNGWPLTIAFVDVDQFKQVNDTYGHQAGDNILVSVARLLVKQLRQNDIVARYGGDEFVIVLPGVGSEALSGLFKRLLGAIGATEHMTSGGQSVRVTASIGLASHMDREYRFDTLEALVRAADQMAYAAKRQGRNRVIVYPAGLT